MLSRPLKRYFFLPLFLLIFLIGSRTAEACSCGPAPTVLDAFNFAEVVVVVSVLSVEKVSDGHNYVRGVKSTTTRVEQVFKGALKVGDEMIFLQGGGANCIWTFNEEDIGQKFLFYLTQSKGSTRWMAGTCGRSDRVDRAADDLLYLNNLNKVRYKTRISGTISFSHDEGESLAGVRIRFVGGKRSEEVKSDENGVYEIYDLPAGPYFVEPEVPKGWKVGEFWLRYSASVDRKSMAGSLQRIPIVLDPNKHAGLNIMFEINNLIRGHIYDALGQPMKHVCLNLIPADGSKGANLADCSESDGSFEINQIPPGGYVIVVNDDGKMTSSEPFGTFYYPKVRKREEATVFNIGLGDFVENVDIHPPIELKTITVEGVLLFSDGKPVADELVFFKPVKKQTEDEDDEDPNEASARTDPKGRFSIRIVQGANGSLFGRIYSYIGKFENCPKLDRLVEQSGYNFMEVKTPPLELRATTNLYEVELKFPFPSCKKAKD